MMWTGLRSLLWRGVRSDLPGGGFALPGLQTLKTVTQVTVLRLFRQRPVTIVERALHNQRIPPVAHLVADAAQLTRHGKAELFMDRQRAGIVMAIADDRQHLPPRAFLALSD